MQTILLVTLVLGGLLGVALLFGLRRRRRAESSDRVAADRARKTAAASDSQAKYAAAGSSFGAGPQPDSESGLRQDSPDLASEAVQEIGSDFYEEVVSLLEAELSQHPQRSDLRFKLLEMYAAIDRKTQFVELAHRHVRAEKGEQDPYWRRIAEMGRQLVPDDALFVEVGVATEAATKPAGEAPKQSRRYYDSVNQRLLGALQSELHKAYQDLRQDAQFWNRLRELCAEVIGPRAPVVHAAKLTSFVGGAQIYVKNDVERPLSDAATIGAVGQALIAKALGRSRVIAGLAGDGHALAVARAARMLGLEPNIVVTEREQEHRAAELAGVTELGARLLVIPDGVPGVTTESQRGALAQALDDGAGTLYLSALAAGPFPYPVIIQELQGLAGRELKSQVSTLAGRAPDGIIVSTADGISAIGFLQAFLGAREVKLYCVETRARGAEGPQLLEREHAWLRATGRVRYSSVPDEVARFAARYCLPDGVGGLHLAGGQVLVETFTLSRQFTREQVVVVVIPAEPAALNPA